MGLIVNKPLPELNFWALLDHLDIARAPESRDLTVHFGGPVERGRGFVLHGRDYAPGAGSMMVPGGLTMTATRDVLADLAQGCGPDQAMLALGYAGWGPGQLEGEIARNDWLTSPLPEGLLFAPDDGAKWGFALRAMGNDPLNLSAVSGRA